VRLPFIVAQEYMRRAYDQIEWSDADFKLFWGEAVGRMNVDCGGNVSEEADTRIFCHDWWVALHYRRDFHVPEN